MGAELWCGETEARRGGWDLWDLWDGIHGVRAGFSLERSHSRVQGSRDRPLGLWGGEGWERDLGFGDVGMWGCDFPGLWGCRIQGCGDWDTGIVGTGIWDCWDSGIWGCRGSELWGWNFPGP